MTDTPPPNPTDQTQNEINHFEISRPSLSRAEILTLTERELDAITAETLFDFQRLCNPNDGGKFYVVMPPDRKEGRIPADPDAKPYHDFTYWVPRYSTDANACRKMEQRIEQMQLRLSYVAALATLLDIADASDVGVCYLFGESNAFWLMTAPLEMRCRAALLAVIGKVDENDC